MATIYDLYIEQGSDFIQSLNMTGEYTGYGITCNTIDSSGNTHSSFAVWTDDSAGEFDIVISNIETTAMSSGVGKYNVEVTDLSGNIDRVIQGRLYVDGDI